MDVAPSSQDAEGLTNLEEAPFLAYEEAGPLGW